MLATGRCLQVLLLAPSTLGSIWNWLGGKSDWECHFIKILFWLMRKTQRKTREPSPYLSSGQLHSFSTWLQACTELTTLNMIFYVTIVICWMPLLMDNGTNIVKDGGWVHPSAKTLLSLVCNLWWNIVIYDWNLDGKLHWRTPMGTLGTMWEPSKSHASALIQPDEQINPFILLNTNFSSTKISSVGSVFFRTAWEVS